MSQVYVCDRCGAIIKDRRKIRTVRIYVYDDECGSPRHPLYDALDFRPGKFDYKGDLCPECLKQLDLFIHTSQYKEE